MEHGRDRQRKGDYHVIIPATLFASSSAIRQVRIWAVEKYVNIACDGWMVNHPGQAMTIYDIPGIVKTAYPPAGTQNNIIAVFRATGISPYNWDLFPDIEFAPGYTTDRPMPNDTRGP